MMNKLKVALQNTLRGFGEDDSPDFVNFEGFGSVLSKIGIFQNLEFEKIGRKLVVSVNPIKMNPIRLSKEVHII